jgi:hypothetical protein
LHCTKLNSRAIFLAYSFTRPSGRRRRRPDAK